MPGKSPPVGAASASHRGTISGQNARQSAPFLTKYSQIRISNREAKFPGNTQTQPFILAAFTQINVVLFYSANRKFENMAGRCAALRPLPAILIPEQRRFSWAPANEIRKSAPSSIPRGPSGNHQAALRSEIRQVAQPAFSSLWGFHFRADKAEWHPRSHARHSLINRKVRCFYMEAGLHPGNNCLGIW